MAETEEELKNLSMKVKEESDKGGLKLNSPKTKIISSGPITSWQIGGETIETVIYFIVLVSKITADGGCRHEIKRHLLLGIKVMTNLDSILKSRDITLPTKVHLVKWLCTSGGQSIGVSASASVLPMNTQDWFLLGWTGWISLQSKGLSRVFSNTTIQKHLFFGAQLSL